MTKLLENIFGIQENESNRAWLMFGAIFLIIASLLIIKPVRNSLFLTEFGAGQLPYAYMLVSIVSGIVTFGFINLSRRLSLGYLVVEIFMFFIVCLFVFWFLLHIGFKPGWFIYVIYAWAALFGTVSASLFWLTANHVFNVREARRVFGFLGLGAITGGIFGGYLTRMLAPVTGTNNLIFICIFFLSVCLLLLKLVWKSQAKQKKFSGFSVDSATELCSSFKSQLRRLYKSKYVKYIALIVSVSTIAGNLVDFQFNTIASDFIQDEDQLTAFFGFWLSNLSVLSLIVQLVLTNKILKSFGVGTSLYFLPAGIMLGAGLLVAVPGIITAVILKVSEGGLKQSVNKAGLEMLYLPIPSTIKDNAKTIIDIFVDNVSIGISGVILILMVSNFGWSVHEISLLVILLTGIWLLLLPRLKREYINSFRTAIERRTINIHDPYLSTSDPQVYESFRSILRGQNQRQILYVLRLLESSNVEKFAKELQQLVYHESGEVASQVLMLCERIPDLNLSADAARLAHHKSPDVRVNALRYLCRTSGDQSTILQDYLNSSDVLKSTAAMHFAATEYCQDSAFRKEFDMLKWFKKIFIDISRDVGKDEVIYIRKSGAMIISISCEPDLLPFLEVFLNDTSLPVLREAVKSAGYAQSPELIPRLFELLNYKPLRHTVRQALARYGDDIIETLGEIAEASASDQHLTFEVCKILGIIGSQKAVSYLFSRIEHSNNTLKFEIYKILSHLRTSNPRLRFPSAGLRKILIQESQNYYGLLGILHQHNINNADIIDNSVTIADYETADRFMIKVLEERIENNLDRIFRLLALKYPAEDIYNAYRGIISGKPELHANSVEFLDSLLDKELRQYLIPIIESRSLDKLVDNLVNLYGPAISSETDYRKLLLEGEDIWLKVTTLYLLSHSGQRRWLKVVGKFRNNTEPILRETAEFATLRLNQSA